jgi:two-component system copper resistance phosphate regulon response regulator CusR
LQKGDSLLTVLIIEDDEEVQLTLKAALRRMGFHCLIARPGRGALEDVAHIAFDLLITDVLMPEVDGLEIIRELRSLGRSTPVIAISGGSTQLPASVGLQLSETFGAQKVLFKPFSWSDLAEAIDALLPSAPRRIPPRTAT